jgi:multidrug efflux system membrane fusion protein
VNPISKLTIAALLGGLTLAGCKKEAPPTPPPPPPTVTATQAVSQDVPVYLDEIGKIVAIDMVSIVPQVSGKIISAHIEDGADVKKGQLLFEIDPRPFEAVLASAQASVAENKANVSWATIEFNRIKGLIESNAVSTNEFERARNALDVANAKHKAAIADEENAKLNLEYCKIVSPIDGRAGARLVVPGNIVRQNDSPILVIQRLAPIYAEFTITENDLGSVRKYIASRGLDLGPTPEKGLKVEVDVPGDSVKIKTALGNATQPAGVLAGGTTRPTTRPQTGPRVGELTFLDNAVQDASGTVRVRATLPNTDRFFWPGQFVNCRLILTTKKDAVLVPVQAQQVGQQGPFVYVVTADSKADLRPIVAGQRQGDLLVVESGVKAGERVIVTGQMMVMPQSPVTVVGDQPHAAPAVAPEEKKADAVSQAK